MSLNSTATSNIELPASLVAVMERSAAQLNVLPAIAMEALKMAKDPDCSMGEFSKLVERDVKLATDILRLSNSVVFSSGSPVHSLHQAVVRLGFRHCKNLILSSSVSGLMQKLSMEESWVRELLWRHSFLTGMLCVHLNRVWNAGFFGEEFTAGLIHDFGRTLFAFALPKEFAKIDPLTFDESPDTLAHEETQIGVNHADLGAWFGHKNQLPSPLIEALRYHHQPELAQENRRLVALVAVGDHLANFLQRSQPGENLSADELPHLDLLESTGLKQLRQRFHDHHREVINQALQDASEMTR